MLKEKIFQMKSINDALPKNMDLRFHLCGITYPNRSYSIERPDSNVLSIEYIVSGSGHIRLGEQDFSQKKGDTYCLPLHADHHYWSDRKDPWEKIWINLSGKLVQELSRQFGTDGTHWFPGLDTSDLLQKFQYYAERPATAQNAEKCVALVTQLFFRMSQALSAAEKPQRTPVQAMLDYIEQHETDVIRLEQLAEVSGKSPSQAERLFRKATSLPPYRYVLNRKIELACQLLTETGMSVRDVASYLSFEDEFYFSGLFRKKVGMSPTQYRKQNTKR
jgi:AraC-like DNA-binding protein